MRGRKPKPLELKVLEGTARKDRAPARAPSTRQGTPHCPDWFDDDHRAEWKKLARQYRDEQRSIQPHEVGIHVSYIVLQVQLGRASRELAVLEAEICKLARPQGLPGLETAFVYAPAPMDQQRDRLLKRIRNLTQEHRAIAAELGLTPSARSRAGWGTPAADKTAVDDPWAKLAGHG